MKGRYFLGVVGSMALAVVALAVAVLAPAAIAEESMDGPQATFTDSLLDSLVGHWDVARQVGSRQERNTLDVEWVLLHQFLQLHMKDVATPPKYEASVMIGYDHAGKRYVIHWCDNFGGKYSLMGHGKRSGDSIEFVFEDPEGNFYNTFTRDPKTGLWSFLMESAGKDGKRVFFAKDTLTRR